MRSALLLISHTSLLHFMIDSSTPEYIKQMIITHRNQYVFISQKWLMQLFAVYYFCLRQCWNLHVITISRKKIWRITRAQTLFKLPLTKCNKYTPNSLLFSNNFLIYWQWTNTISCHKLEKRNDFSIVFSSRKYHSRFRSHRSFHSFLATSILDCFTQIFCRFLVRSVYAGYNPLFNQRISLVLKQRPPYEQEQTLKGRIRSNHWLWLRPFNSDRLARCVFLLSAIIMIGCLDVSRFV